ncbi:MAG TPA: 4-(cytidine 5'-diphospho)-2-C-methyl-D-erythritol kinase, partial [Actinomycetota bacterium]|nr:4-(cytidine 5'-diphospho)-2-C-methyl-D-erythritol kinase [Actinomycetota bacterium]
MTGSAKVNLGWLVSPPRPDGFHPVAGLVQTLSLHDTLTITTGDPTDRPTALVDGEPLTLSTTGPEASPALDTEENLIVRAARLVAGRTAPLPTTVALEKRIPVAAGLGGGSADAAAALVGLSAAWGAKRSVGALLDLGARLGSDVPPILLGGLVAVSGKGERVQGAGCGAGYAVVL